MYFAKYNINNRIKYWTRLYWLYILQGRQKKENQKQGEGND